MLVTYLPTVDVYRRMMNEHLIQRHFQRITITFKEVGIAIENYLAFILS